MRAIQSCYAAVLLVGMAGCITSVNPLYESAEDLESPAPYFGTWQSEKYLISIVPALPEEERSPFGGEAEAVKHERMVRKLARVGVLEDPRMGRIALGAPIPPRKTGFFVAGIVKIDGRHYLDLTTSHFYQDPEAGPTVWGHLLPVHSIARIELKDGRLLISPVDIEKFRELLSRRPEAVRHIPYRPVPLDEGDAWRADLPVLTSSSAELRQFLKDHGKRDIWQKNQLEFEKADPKLYDEHFEKLGTRRQATEKAREADAVQMPMQRPTRRSPQPLPAAVVPRVDQRDP
ncbi:MAG: hypothetical protein WD066_15390 [Planctomycetaceae bacterium]